MSATLAVRIPEPEKMTEEEEAHYARADYSVPHEALAAEVAALVGEAPGVHIVDLGCGPGDVLLRLRRRGAWGLWGVDMSPGMLGHAAEDGAHRLQPTDRPVNWVLSDVKRTGLPARFFGGVISNSVLHHLSDPVAFWREVKRIAIPGAAILVRDLRRPATTAEADRLVALHVGRESTVVQDHYRSSLASSFTVSEVQAQLAEAGIGGLVVSALADRYLDVQGRIEVLS